MKQEEYKYSRGEIAEAAGVSTDVVRMEQKKGTFGSVWGLARWVVAKKLLQGGNRYGEPEPKEKDYGDGVTLVLDDEQKEGSW